MSAAEDAKGPANSGPCALPQRLKTKKSARGPKKISSGQKAALNSRILVLRSAQSCAESFESDTYPLAELPDPDKFAAETGSARESEAEVVGPFSLDMAFGLCLGQVGF